jgi:hypothetical protein
MKQKKMKLAKKLRKTKKTGDLVCGKFFAQTFYFPLTG